MAWNFKNPWAENIWASPQEQSKVLDNEWAEVDRREKSGAKAQDGKDKSLYAARVCIIFDKENGTEFYSEYEKTFTDKAYYVYRVRSGYEMLNTLVKHQSDVLKGNYLKYLVVLSHGQEKKGVVAAPAGHNTGIYSNEFVNLNKDLDHYIDFDFVHYGYPEGISYVSDFAKQVKEENICFDKNAICIFGGCSVFSHCDIIDYDIENYKKNNLVFYGEVSTETIEEKYGDEKLKAFLNINFAVEWGNATKTHVIGAGRYKSSGYVADHGGKSSPIPGTTKRKAGRWYLYNYLKNTQTQISESNTFDIDITKFKLP